MARKKRNRKPRKHKTKKEQPQAAPRPPVPLPSNTSHPADAQQVKGERQDGGINQQNNRKVEKMDWPNIVNLVFTACVAAATIGLVIVGAYQLNIIRSQIAQTQETLRLMQLDQRAWLAITNTKLLNLEAGKEPRIKYTIKNTGATPAKIKSFTCTPSAHDAKTGRHVVSNKTIDECFAEMLSAPPNEWRAVIAPGADTTAVFAYTDIATEPHVGAIHRGERILYFYGRVLYEDAFADDLETTYCFYYIPAPEDILAIHKQYNDMK